MCGYLCHPKEHHLGDFQHTLALNFKSTHENTQHACPTAAVQQQRTSHRFIHITLCSLFSTCDIPGISSQPHPEGEPCMSSRMKLYTLKLSDKVLLKLCTHLQRVACQDARSNILELHPKSRHPRKICHERDGNVSLVADSQKQSKTGRKKATPRCGLFGRASTYAASCEQ